MRGCTYRSQLLEDLKHLYVALTRARRRVILFDQSDARIPYFELCERRGLGVMADLQNLSAGSRSGDSSQYQLFGHALLNDALLLVLDLQL